MISKSLNESPGSGSVEMFSYFSPPQSELLLLLQDELLSAVDMTQSRRVAANFLGVLQWAVVHPAITAGLSLPGGRSALSAALPPVVLIWRA